MKFFCCLFLFVLTTIVALGQDHQAAQDSLSLKINSKSLQKAFNQIEIHTSLVFIYPKSHKDLNQHVTLTANRRPLEEILNTLLENTNLTWKRINQQIIIYEQHTDSSSPSMPFTLQGYVTNRQGEPLTGASLIDPENKTGVVTDWNGHFHFNKMKTGTLLQCSFIGYKTKEIKITNKIQHIILEEDPAMLDEVVVIGYGEQRHSQVSGAVAQLSGSQLYNQPVNSLGEALQGRLANLNIKVGSGHPREVPFLNVRGSTSINGGDPLIIVDNIPTTAQGLTRINPNDIETISVLKDAASVAIYGGRASYGVILITTRSAKSRNTEFSINAMYSVKILGRHPQIITDPYEVASFKNIMATPWYELFTQEDLEYARLVSKGLAPVTRINPQDPRLWQHYGTTDWYREVYRRFAPSYQINFHVGQKNQLLNYWLSGEYFPQSGLFDPGTDSYNRLNLRVKIDCALSEWLRLSSNTSYSAVKSNQPSWADYSFFHQLNRNPTLGIPRNEDGTWTKEGASILGILEEGGRNKENTGTFNATLGFQASFLHKQLQFRGDINFVKTTENTNAWKLPVTGYPGPNYPQVYPESWSMVPTAFNRNGNMQHIVLNGVVDWNRQFEFHKLQLLVGFNQENYRTTRLFTQRTMLISEKQPDINLATGDKEIRNQSRSWTLRGTFYRFNYNFRDRYILELIGRYDGTSRFSSANRFVFFPSFAGVWLVNNESFWKDRDHWLKRNISLFKLRFSYGALGNQQVNHYEYIPTMQINTSDWLIGGRRPETISPPGLVSDHLTWEKVIQYNWGMDMILWNQRLNLSFNKYNRRTQGMLSAGQQLPGVLGTSVPRENAADLLTKGWEISFEWKDCFQIGANPLHYSLRLELSDSHSRITRFTNPMGTLDSYYAGQHIGEIWGFRTEGFFKDKNDIQTSASQRQIASNIGTHPIEPGDLKFADLNHDGIISYENRTLEKHGDAVVIGNSSDRYPYSMLLNLDWIGFDISLFFQGIGKKDYWPAANNHYFWGVYAQPWANVLKSNMDHWTPENPNGYFPRPKAYVASANWVEAACPNDRYLQDASYCRLKNLTIGYTFPQTWSKKIRFKKLRLFFSGENLALITKLCKNLDPEGLEGMAYPFQKTFSIGINCDF